MPSNSLLLLPFFPVGRCLDTAPPSYVCCPVSCTSPVGIAHCRPGPYLSTAAAAAAVATSLGSAECAAAALRPAHAARSHHAPPLTTPLMLTATILPRSKSPHPLHRPYLPHPIFQLSRSGIRSDYNNPFLCNIQVACLSVCCSSFKSESSVPRCFLQAPRRCKSHLMRHLPAILRMHTPCPSIQIEGLTVMLTG